MYIDDNLDFYAYTRKKYDDL